MPVKALPPTIQKMIVQHQLGMPQTVYEARKEVWPYRLLGLFALLVGTAIVSYFTYTYDGIFGLWPAWQITVVLLIAAGWLVVGVWILLSSGTLRRERVFVCIEGLIYDAPSRIDVIRWNQMERIWKQVHSNWKGQTINSYVVRRSDRAFFEFKHDLASVEELGMLVEEEITRRLLPRAIAAYCAGESVLFDDVAISMRWIRVRSGRQDARKLSWDDFERMHSNEKFIEMYKKGQMWCALKVAMVPNVKVLGELVNYGQRMAVWNRLPEVMIYNTGLPVAFGPLSISQHGIQINNSASILPWDEIAGVGVGESEVIIQKKGPIQDWYALPTWMIADTETLRELVSYIITLKSY